MLNTEGFLRKFACRTRDGDRFRLCVLWEERNGPEHILPIQLPEKDKEMALSDIQIEAFWGLKTAHFIADILSLPEELA